LGPKELAQVLRQVHLVKHANLLVELREQGVSAAVAVGEAVTSGEVPLEVAD